MYILEITPKNSDANGPYFNQWLRDNFIFDGIGYYSNKVLISFQDEPVQSIKTEIIDKYNSLTTADIIPTYDIKKTYTDRQADGVVYYDNVRADIALEFINGEITEGNANYIENKVKFVKSKILTGDWATAQYEITNNVLIDGTVTQEDIDNGYTQERHDKIKAEIDTYVSEHY
jgi:hypothetical protein